MATSQTWTSPIRPGRPPVTASRLPSGEKRDRLDPLGQADQPADQLGAVGLPEQDLVEAGDGQQLAVGREVERRDHRRPGVDGRVVHVVAGARRSPGVSSTAPWAIHCVISSISAAASGGLSLGISALPSVGRDLLDQVALGRLARDDRRAPSTRRPRAAGRTPSSRSRRPALAGWWQPWQWAWKIGRTCL